MVPVTSQLVVNSVSDIERKFGKSGDYIVNCILPNDKGPYKGLVLVKVPHNRLYGNGRFLVQNKGLVLDAIDNPLPDSVTGGNDTEKAIILAIAMQASALSDPSCLCGLWLQAHWMPHALSANCQPPA